MLLNYFHFICYLISTFYSNTHTQKPIKIIRKLFSFNFKINQSCHLLQKFFFSVLKICEMQVK
jgi:hypothetical protein